MRVSNAVPTKRGTLLMLGLALSSTGCAVSPDEPREYSARLRSEASRLTLHAADTEPGTLRVWLSASHGDSDDCPRFELKGSIHRRPLQLVDAGGLIRVSSQAPHRSDHACTLPIYEFRYDPEEAQPNPWVLELGDASLTFHATVSAPADTPMAQAEDSQTSARASVPCSLSPSVSPGGMAALLEDAAGFTHILNVLENSGDRLVVAMPAQLATGAATLRLVTPNWVPTHTERCDGPSQCQLAVRASIGGYAARSTAHVALQVR